MTVRLRLLTVGCIRLQPGWALRPDASDVLRIVWRHEGTVMLGGVAWVVSDFPGPTAALRAAVALVEDEHAEGPAWCSVGVDVGEVDGWHVDGRHVDETWNTAAPVVLRAGALARRAGWGQVLVSVAVRHLWADVRVGRWALTPATVGSGEPAYRLVRFGPGSPTGLQQRAGSAGSWASLSPREREVTALVAEGLSNQQIAGHLHISRRTVEAHLSHVYTKMDLRGRAHLAAVHERHVRATPLDPSGASQ